MTRNVRGLSANVCRCEIELLEARMVLDGSSLLVGCPASPERVDAIVQASGPRAMGTEAGADISIAGLLSGVEREIPDGSTVPRQAQRTRFGTVDARGGFTWRTYRIHNDGDVELNPVVTLSGPGAAAFRLVRLPDAIGPGGSTTFRLRFDPSVWGVQSATVGVAAAGLTLPFTFAVRGRSVSPEIYVTSGSAVIEDDQDREVHFGSWETHEDADRSFDIHNVGNAPLNLGLLTLNNSDGFIIRFFPASHVAVGDTTTFVIRLKTDRTRFDANSEVYIASDDPDEGVFGFRVQGSVFGGPF